MKQTTIRGIPFHNVTMSEALLLAEEKLGENGVSVVVTPNAEIAQLALEDEKVMATIRNADIILPDGAGVIMASEILKTPLKEKVAGVDFGLKLLAYAEKKELPVYLLGGKPCVAEKASERLKARLPQLLVSGTHDGYFEKSGAETDAVINEINKSGAVILLVCLGAPTQEFWIMQNREKLTNVRLAACLGGSLDVYAGTVRRAPRLFIRFRLEWFWRLLKEPRRLPRMMRLPRYIKGAKKEAKAQRKSTKK